MKRNVNLNEKKTEEEKEENPKIWYEKMHL